MTFVENQTAVPVLAFAEPIDNLLEPVVLPGSAHERRICGKQNTFLKVATQPSRFGLVIQLLNVSYDLRVAPQVG